MITKRLERRIKESLNVSAAFDNCFFHCYAAHLLANNVPLPQEIFTFNSLLGEDSYATQLQKRFPNQDSFSLFARYCAHENLDGQPEHGDFIVEKTLILGFLLREWFATLMTQNPQIADEMSAKISSQFQGYIEMRLAPADKDLLLSGAEGVLFEANMEFLEDCVAKKVPNADLPELISAYWQREGYQKYCAALAKPKTKVSHSDVLPVMTILQQPITIYDKRSHSTIYQKAGKSDVPVMEMALDVLSAHYHLLQTNKTKPILSGYAQSFKRYLEERTRILADSGANEFSSLLVESIIPEELSQKPPFKLLLEKLDIMGKIVAIDRLFEQLKEKIGGIDQHEWEDAYHIASNLLETLEDARNNYCSTLHVSQTKEECEKISKEFIDRCHEAIEEAKPVLERDLAWGDYLINWFKSVVNAVIFIVTVANVHGFFTPKRAASALAVEELEAQIKNELN